MTRSRTPLHSFATPLVLLAVILAATVTLQAYHLKKHTIKNRAGSN